VGIERSRGQSRGGHQAVDIGGYYRPDVAKLNVAMRPSATFNAALKTLV
jgi:monomeric isocitrate dehydrogenase